MTKDYPDGMEIRLLQPKAQKGKIVGRLNDTNDMLRYEVLFDSGYKMLVNWNELAPLDHPWHEQMKKWRAEGLSKGFTSIFIAMEDNRYKAFFGNETLTYNHFKLKYPHLKFLHYWAL